MGFDINVGHINDRSPRKVNEDSVQASESLLQHLDVLTEGCDHSLQVLVA